MEVTVQTEKQKQRELVKKLICGWHYLGNQPSFI